MGPVATGGSQPYVAFVPAPLPRVLALEPATITALSSADASLGRLAGAGAVRPHSVGRGSAVTWYADDVLSVLADEGDLR
jgi:hypothetical protein